MTSKLRKCTACGGLGYFRCDCWPADCICDEGDETCFECGGEGVIDPMWDDDFRDAVNDDEPPPPVEREGSE